jgi:hypothetical protein
VNDAKEQAKEEAMTPEHKIAVEIFEKLHRDATHRAAYGEVTIIADGILEAITAEREAILQIVAGVTGLDENSDYARGIDAASARIAAAIRARKP